MAIYNTLNSNDENIIDDTTTQITSLKKRRK